MVSLWDNDQQLVGFPMFSPSMLVSRRVSNTLSDFGEIHLIMGSDWQQRSSAKDSAAESGCVPGFLPWQCSHSEQTWCVLQDGHCVMFSNGASPKRCQKMAGALCQGAGSLHLFKNKHRHPPSHFPEKSQKSSVIPVICGKIYIYSKV